MSPRKRAHDTFHLLFQHLTTPPPHSITEEVREWDYGDYEGITTSEIHKTRPDWEIFRDGYAFHGAQRDLIHHALDRCPGGERPEDIRDRVDGVITKVT